MKKFKLIFSILLALCIMCSIFAACTPGQNPTENPSSTPSGSTPSGTPSGSTPSGSQSGTVPDEPDSPDESDDKEMNEVEMAAYIAKTITTNPTKPTNATFRKMTSDEIPAVTEFDYAYYYKKIANRREDETCLVLNCGNIVKLSLDVYVKSATGDTINWKITAGKFISVTDEDGNTVTINEGTYPSAPLVKGKTYHIEIDLTDVGRCGIHVAYAKATELIYSNFVFTEGQNMNVTRTVVYRNVSSETCYEAGKSYFAWPSVANIGGDRMLAVCSGYRSAHVSPDGRVVGFLSEDGGKTWSDPFTIIDTPLDDRDSGVIFWKNKIIVTWFTHTKDYNDTYKAYWDSLNISDEEEAKYLGGNSITGTINDDGSIDWGEVNNIRMFSPHGIIEDPDGNLVYVGYFDYNKTKKGWSGIGIMKSTDGENWSDLKVIADVTAMAEYKFNEPHAVFTEEGKLIVMLRSEYGAGSGMYQCESTDGGNTFTEFKYVIDSPSTPPNFLRMTDGTLVLTYGTRGTTTLYGGSGTSHNKGYGLIARISYDNGITWSQPIILSMEGAFTSGNYASGDIGYSSSTERSDGSILTVYYTEDCSNDGFTSIVSVVWNIPKKEGNPVVTFDLDGGSGTESISGAFGTKMTAPKIPRKDGYYFLGWYEDKDLRIPFNFTNFYTSRTVYAKWLKLEVEPEANANNLRDATEDDLADTGYVGDGDAWVYTKKSGTAAGPGKSAQVYMDVDSSLMKTLTFSVYMKSYSYTNNTTACHLEVDGAKNAVTFKNSDGKVMELTQNTNQDGSVKGVTAYINQGEWYTVTVDVSDGVERINPFCWSGAKVTMIIADISVELID